MAKIATIGFFDGVHRGHRFLFAQLQDRARALNLTPLIYTFDQHPKQVLTGKCPPMLTLLQERQKWLEQYAEVVVLKFTEVQHLTAQEFMSYLHTE
jgi:riboflavin kinase/FMN adenylyltransferase